MTPVGALALAVLAADPWSGASAATAGAGKNLVVAAIGWPGVELGYERGLGPRLDLGVRVSYHYGYEGLFTRLEGGRVQGVLRLLLAEGEKVTLGLTVAPGVLFYVPRNVLVGFTVPALLALSVSIDRGVVLSLLAELPLWYRFGAGGGLAVPLLLGVGLELSVTPNVSVFLRGRGGPTFFSYSSRPVPTLDARAGVAFRF